MKIDRRSFIALSIGAGVGINFTPLPWKLTDDLSIWTQNWPWTPVPEKGEVSYVRSVCTLCPGACGIMVRKVNGRAVRIEGMENHPVNSGGICPLGLSGLQYLYGPARVKTPLKREGKRGEGKWKEIGWDEALRAVTKQLADLRADNNPQGVAWIAGSERGTIARFIDRFLSAYGSPNFIRPAGAGDTLEQAVYLTQGQLGTVGYDLENTNFILSFGAGLLEGWGSPVRMLHLHGNRYKDRTLVQIEPRLSDTAAKADQWIGINPGTEGTLALGLAHVIIKESLYNMEFIENATAGFDNGTDENGQTRQGFREMVLENYATDKVSRITGVPPRTIEDLARRFARADKKVAIFGRGQGSIPGSMSDGLAVHALNALVGAIYQPGGISVVPEPDFAKWPESSIDETASQGRQQPRIDGAGTDAFPYSRYLMTRLPEIINSASGDAPFKALLISEANPLYTLPDTTAAKKAFDRIELIVSFSTYMDETAAYADYILPNHSYLERLRDVPSPEGLPYSVIGLAKPAVKPLYDTRHIGDVVIQMAKVLGGFVADAFPWNDYESFLKEALADHWRQLNSKGFVVIRHPSSELAPYEFATASGKFEFLPLAGNGSGGDKRLAWPQSTPLPIEGDVQRFPLVLIPYDSLRMANQHIANAPFMTKTIDDTVLKKQLVSVEVNPQTAGRLGLGEGDMAELSTPKGKAVVRIHLQDGIQPDLLALPRGFGRWGFPEEWYINDKGVNFNDLIGPIPDPLSGLDTAWGIRARLTRA
jgi:menaquinone reductase, molybdopterin-binding-like subunit